MKRRLTILIFLTLSALISCTKEELELEYSNQEKKIEEFVNKELEKSPDYSVVNNNGVTRLTVVAGSGAELDESGTAVVFYAGYNFSKYTIDKSSLIATNNKDIASASGIDTSDESRFKEINICPSEADLIPGLAYGLKGVKAGEECYIIFSGRHGTGKHSAGTIPANSPLAYRIWVMEVKN